MEQEVFKLTYQLILPALAFQGSIQAAVIINKIIIITIITINNHFINQICCK